MNTETRKVVQYKFSKKELNSPSRPAYYDLLVKKDPDIYFGDKPVVFQEDINDFVADFVDDINNPAAMRGSLAVYKAISREYMGVSRRDVERVLKNMENNQLFAPAPTVPVVRPQTPKQPGHLAADTAFIEHKGERLFTILIAVDIFSKYLSARIVQIPETHQRFSGKSVAAAMGEILTEFGRGSVMTVKTDNGVEFKSADFEALLRDRGIKHLYSIPHNPRSNAFAESAVKSIKVLIGKYLNSVNGVMVDGTTLRTLVDSYNHTFHSTIKAEPETVHYGSAKEQNVAKANIKKRAVRVVAKTANTYPALKVGDRVRVHKRTESSWRRYTALKTRIYETQWSSEIFTVNLITRAKPGVSSHYYLALNGSSVTHPFIRPDLQKVDTGSLVKNLPSRNHYVVSKILDSRTRAGKKIYLVEWAGYPRDQASWVPAAPSFVQKIADYERLVTGRE